MTRTFYDDWLEARQQIDAELAACPPVARDKQIPWVTTPQDARVKLMIANSLGFSTMGSNVLKAEIPVGWHTGKHKHGEEAMHILAGEGFSVINGRRFDWHTGSTIHLPFWAEHQHFNIGDVPVQYLSAMVFDLERFTRVARIEQLDVCGPNVADAATSIPAETSQFYDDGGRAVLHIEDAPTTASEDDPQGKLAAVKNQHDFTWYLMVPRNGFRNISVGVTHQWTEPAYHHSGMHAHLEAVVYALEGSGFTDMNGAQVMWEAGDVLYVPPAMWEHMHSNPTPVPVRQLRIAFGIRQWFTDVWPDGFTNRRIYDEDGNPIEAGPIIRERERA